MARVKISTDDIERQMSKHPANLPRDFTEFNHKLYRSLALPSYVHGYSLAIEYMKNWFVKKFDTMMYPDYFKCIHINGKHVLDDWKHFNNHNIKREKPMLAIVPTVEYDYDKESIDLYLADQNMYLRRTQYQQSFLKDYTNDVFLAMEMREMKMNFGFKIRVNSRAEQQDLFNRMELWFRIGATQFHELSADLHVPYDIMLNIAHDLNFDIDERNQTIINVMDFVSYLNSHSEIPFIFKMRAINQKPEFFIRTRNLPVHINTTNKLQLDDGERVGKLDTNFHIEMQATLRIAIPHFFVYFSQKPIQYKIMVRDKPQIGIYSINAYEILPENHLGWNLFAQTGYLCEKGEQVIPLDKIFAGDGNIATITRYSIDHGINPSSFVDVMVLHSDDVAVLVPFRMDFESLRIILDEPMRKEEMVNIAIYVDRKYINDGILMMKNYNDSSRIGAKDNIKIN